MMAKERKGCLQPGRVPTLPASIVCLVVGRLAGRGVQQRPRIWYCARVGQLELTSAEAETDLPNLIKRPRTLS